MKKLSLKLAVMMIVSIGICMYGNADDKVCRRCDGGYAKVQKHMRMEEKSSFDEKFYKKILFIFMNSKEINLTEDQMDKIHAVKINVKKILKMKKAEIDVLMIDFGEEFNKDEVDLKAVNSLIDKKYEIKKTIAIEIARGCAEIHKILSKEQSKKLKDICFNGTIEKCKNMMGFSSGNKCCKDDQEKKSM